MNYTLEDYKKDEYPIYPSVRNKRYEDQAKDTGPVPNYGVKRPHHYVVWSLYSAICMQCQCGHETQGMNWGNKIKETEGHDLDPNKVQPRFGCPGPPIGEESLGVGDS